MKRNKDIRHKWTIHWTKNREKKTHEIKDHNFFQKDK